MQETFICDSCGDERPVEAMNSFDGQTLCSNCYEETVLVCRHCGERIWRDDNAGDEDIVLCQRCYDQQYTNCTRCGCLLHSDDIYYDDDDSDGDPYCSRCYSEHDSGAINGYSYKPVPCFYGEGPRYYGIELEVDGGGKLSSNARQLLSIANAERELLYIKSDGSLDDGMELVTHPMSCTFHMTEMPWEEITQKCIQLGYKSHKASTCGLHIHVARAALGNTEEQQDSCISRIMFLVERFWQEMLRFSRRTEYQIQRWAARYGYKDKPKDILDHAKKGYGNRYTCINITNRDTIEFRIFRGTLKYNTLIATLQIVDQICNVAILLSDEELADLSWPEFVSNIPGTSGQLITYLKERMLYVNEPISDVEEED